MALVSMEFIYFSFFIILQGCIKLIYRLKSIAQCLEFGHQVSASRMAKARILGNLGLFVECRPHYKSWDKHDPASWNNDKIMRLDAEILIVKVWQAQAQPAI